MNALLATPIPVPNGDSREQLEGTGHIGNIHQPFQRRMEVCSCKLSMPAIGCRELEPGDPIRVIVQEEMHQFVREVVENGMHDKQGWLSAPLGPVLGRLWGPRMDFNLSKTGIMPTTNQLPGSERTSS